MTLATATPTPPESAQQNEQALHLPQPTAPREHNRIEQLDALRGVAAMWVMLYHYTIQYSGDYGHGPGVWRVPFGQRAVELFFMISGFVIPMTLSRTRRPMDFVVSRFSRLYPAFWACLLLTTLITWRCGLPRMSARPVDVAANVTMAPTLLFHRPYVDPSYWTLECELVFYVIAFSAWWIGRDRGMVAAVLGLTALSLFEGLLIAAGLHGFGGVVDALLLQFFIGDFACGLGVNLIRLQRRWRLGAALIALGLAAVALRSGLMAAGVTAVLAAVVAGAAFDRLPGLSMRPLLLLGAISYPLYLVHQNIGYIFIHRGYAMGFSPNVNVTAACAVAIALAALVSLTIERPFMRAIRDRYRKGRGRIEAGTTYPN